jgi:hypothetical protein
MNCVVPVSLAVAALVSACALVQAKETRYLHDAQDRADQKEVTRVLGRPVLATTDSMGRAVWVYQLREQDPGNRWTSSGLWCDEYVLTFDEGGILRHWTHKSHFHGGELMPAYCVPGGVPMPAAVNRAIFR